MARARLLIDQIIRFLSCSLLSAMIIVVTWQVISRYVLNAPSTFSEELLRFGVIWLSLIGAAYATGRGTHMAVDLFKEMAGGRLRLILDFLVPVAFIAFAVAVLIVGGLWAVTIAAQQYSAVLHIPMGAIYAALPTSGVLIILYSILNIVELLQGRYVEPSPVEKALKVGD
jgi:TRAP-type C4-dicarboxylate transport system permease small subunit